MQKLSMEQLNRLDVASFRGREKTPVVLVLDGVRSMHNVGSAFRTADAFAIEKILLCGITATPPHREIEKTALGATQSVAWEHHETAREAVERLRGDGYQILAVEQAMGSTLLGEFRPTVGEKTAFVFGNEVHGVSDEVMAIVDGCIEIPQFGTKHSLNVSVAIGIILWDFVYKYRVLLKTRYFPAKKNAQFFFAHLLLFFFTKYFTTYCLSVPYVFILLFFGCTYPTICIFLNML